MSFDLKQDMTQVRLHEKWKKTPALYVKPPAPAPGEMRSANLINVPECRESLSYILFVDGVKVIEQGCGAHEFLRDDPEPLRAASLAMKSKPGFHVYYKHSAFWYGVTRHFDNLADAIQSIQTGLRVLIEYRFTAIAVKYIVYPGSEIHPTSGAHCTYRSGEKLCELYGIDPAECMFAEFGSYLPPNGPLIAIKPLYSAEPDDTRKDYHLARLNLKHYGRLAPAK